MDGNLIAKIAEPCPIGDSYSVAYPEVEFFTCIGSDIEERTIIIPTEDTVIDVFYDCEGLMGAAAVGEAVTELEGGASYLIYNAKDETSRSGFLSVGAVGDGITTTNGIADAGPAFIWHLEGDDNKFTVKNSYGVYIPRLLRGSLVRGSDTPEQFIFTLNSDGKTWEVKGTSNNYYWNGNADNTFTGGDGGHPFIIYTYMPHPYFAVSYKCVDEEGNELATGMRYVKGGNIYSMLTPIFDGYTLTESNADYDELARVSKNIDITLTYTKNDTGITEVKGENGNVKAIYDLQGRKVTAPTNGIYIKDGNKIFVK